MTIHYPCREIFERLVKAILVRAEMDESVFEVMDRTGREWEYVRRAIDPAMSTQNVEVQKIMRELLECECELYREEAKKGERSV